MAAIWLGCVRSRGGAHLAPADRASHPARGGAVMSLENLQEVKNVLRPVTRWTHAKKFWLIEAIKGKVITAEAACELHNISLTELNRWKELKRQHGAGALKSTMIQKYRAAHDEG
jgi:hypothetical protein